MNFLAPFLDSNGNIIFNDLKDTEYIISLTKKLVNYYKKEVNRLSKIKNPTVENFIKPYDELANYLSTYHNMIEFYQNLGLLSPKMISSFDDLNYKAVNYESNHKLFIKKIKQFYKNRHSYTTDQRHAIEKNCNDLLSNGAFLSPKKQKQIINLNSSIRYLLLDFDKNIRGEEHSKRIFFKNKKDVVGIPQNFLKSFKKNKGYSVPLTYANYSIMMQNCSVDETRKKIYSKYLTIGSNKNKYNNLPVVSKILKKRYQKAKLLGFFNYAEYISTNNKVFKNVNKNKQNLLKFIKENSKLMKIENEHLLKTKKSLNMTNTDRVMSYDLRYLEHQQNKKSKDISKYLTLDNTLKSLFKISNNFFNYKIVFNKKESKKLANGLFLFNILEKNKVVGNIYLDPFSRQNKPSGCFYTDLTAPSSFCKMKNVYISLNYRKNKDFNQVFLSFEDVVVLYHEFGHFFQSLMGKGEFLSNKADMEWDLVEFPSFLFEKILSNKNFIQSWAKHHKTKKKLPLSILKNVKKEGYPLINYQRQAFYALLDLEIHQANPNKIKSIAQFEKDFYTKYEKYNFNSFINTDFLCLPSLEHIFGNYNYDASYYSYLYALALESTVYKQIANKSHNRWKPFFKKLKNNFFAKLGTDKGIKLYRNLTKKEEPSFKNWHNQILKQYYT